MDNHYCRKWCTPIVVITLKIDKTQWLNFLRIKKLSNYYVLICYDPPKLSSTSPHAIINGLNSSNIIQK